MSAPLQDQAIVNSEVGTIICALRLWQQQYGPGEYCGEHFAGNENPLTDAQVDDLCQRLNFGRAILVELPPGFGKDDAVALLDWVKRQSPTPGDGDAEDSVSCQFSFMENVIDAIGAKP